MPAKVIQAEPSVVKAQQLVPV